MKLKRFSFIEIFIIISIAFYTILFPANIFGNDTFVYDNGHSVYPINTDKVRMVSEKIIVTMEGERFDRRAFVECSFLFENTTNEEISAKLGFPAKDDYFYDQPEGYEKIGPLTDFISYIEGKETEVELKSEGYGKYWYTWNVGFPPYKKIELKNTYNVPLSLSYYNQWFEYILITGANWKGSIDKAVIEIIYKNPHDLKRRVVKAYPDSFKIQDNKIVWKFENFTPKKNIHIYEKNLVDDYYYTDPRLTDILIREFASKKYEGGSRYYNKKDLVMSNEANLAKLIEVSKEVYIGNVTNEEQFLDELNRQYVATLRNEIFARHGRPFKSEYFQIMFKRQSWDELNLNFTYDMLNEYEKKNVKFILQYEQQKCWK